MDVKSTVKERRLAGKRQCEDFRQREVLIKINATEHALVIRKIEVPRVSVLGFFGHAWNPVVVLSVVPSVLPQTDVQRQAFGLRHQVSVQQRKTQDQDSDQPTDVMLGTRKS